MSGAVALLAFHGAIPIGLAIILILILAMSGDKKAQEGIGCLAIVALIFLIGGYFFIQFLKEMG